MLHSRCRWGFLNGYFVVDRLPGGRGDKPFVFRIISPTQPTAREIAAPSEEDMLQWIQCIRECSCNAERAVCWPLCLYWPNAHVHQIAPIQVRTDHFTNIFGWPQIFSCMLLIYSFQLRSAFYPWYHKLVFQFHFNFAVSWIWCWPVTLTF